MIRFGTSVGPPTVLLLALSGSIVTAQSLADVARQAADQRKLVAQPSKLLTNADLKPDPLSRPPSLLLPPPEQPAQALQPPAAEPLSTASDNEPGEPAPSHRSAPAERVDNQYFWQGQPPSFIPPILGPTYGVNTPREQAMSNYMRAAGFDVPRAPEPAAPERPHVPPPRPRPR